MKLFKQFTGQKSQPDDELPVVLSAQVSPHSRNPLPRPVPQLPVLCGVVKCSSVCGLASSIQLKRSKNGASSKGVCWKTSKCASPLVQPFTIVCHHSLRTHNMYKSNAHPATVRVQTMIHVRAAQSLQYCFFAPAYCFPHFQLPALLLCNKSRSHYLHTYLHPDANTDACRHGLFWTRASSKAQQIGPHVRAQNVEQGSGIAHQTARPHLVRKARSRRAVISFYCQHVYIIPGRNLPVYGAGVLDWRRIFYALA